MTIYTGDYAETEYLRMAEEDAIYEGMLAMFELWCDENDITGEEKRALYEEFVERPEAFGRG